MSAITKVIQILGRKPNAGTGADRIIADSGDNAKLHRFSFRDDGIYIDELHLKAVESFELSFPGGSGDNMRMRAEICCYEYLPEGDKYPTMNRVMVEDRDVFLDGILLKNVHYFKLKNAGINMVCLSLVMEVS
jgi:hypothetical protein